MRRFIARTFEIAFNICPCLFSEKDKSEWTVKTFRQGDQLAGLVGSTKRYQEFQPSGEQGLQDENFFLNIHIALAAVYEQVQPVMLNFARIEALKEAAFLNGCYVIKTDLPGRQRTHRSSRPV